MHDAFHWFLSLLFFAGSIQFAVVGFKRNLGILRFYFWALSLCTNYGEIGNL